MAENVGSLLTAVSRCLRSSAFRKKNNFQFWKMNFVRKTRVGHKKNILALDINTDGILSSVAEDGHCILWSSDGQIIHDINVNNEHGHGPGLTSDECPLNSVIFNLSDGNKLYISSGMQVLAYDMRKCSAYLTKFDLNEDEINQLCVNSTGRYLAACDDLGEIKVIDIQESRLFKTLGRRHDNICSSVQFRHKKSWQLLSAGLDCNIINWDFSNGKPQQIFKMSDHISKHTEDNQTLFINPPFVHSLSVAQDGKTFATGLGNGEIGLFQFQGKSFKCTERLKCHDSEVSQVYYFNFGSTERCLVSGGNDGKINVWKEIQTGKNIKYELYHKILHDSKINWITCSLLKKDCVFVADQSSNITVYELK